MNKSILILFLLIFTMSTLLCPLCGSAQQPSGNKKILPPSSDLPVGMLRDPFWPVGWQPPEFQAGSESDSTRDIGELMKWREASKQIVVTALSNTKNGFVAILKNIGVVCQGDAISVDYNGLTYKWKVTNVTQEGVNIEKIGVFPIK